MRNQNRQTLLPSEAPLLEAKPTSCVADVARKFLDAVLEGRASARRLCSNPDAVANPTRAHPAAISPTLIAALTLAAIVTGPAGCTPAPTAREAYFDSRSLLVEPKEGDHAITVSAWPWFGPDALAAIQEPTQSDLLVNPR